jgi:hypothetical protein
MNFQIKDELDRYNLDGLENVRFEYNIVFTKNKPTGKDYDLINEHLKAITDIVKRYGTKPKEAKDDNDF